MTVPHEINESDWKVLRRLHPVALERFCERALTEKWVSLDCVAIRCKLVDSSALRLNWL